MNIGACYSCWTAEGNPDEEKIGAFGVGMLPTSRLMLLPKTIAGFYSLFSVTEEPFVVSGGKKYLSGLFHPSDSVKVMECNFTGRTKQETK